MSKEEKVLKEKQAAAAEADKNSFTSKHAELWKFIKFSFAGVFATGVELGIYYALIYTVFKNIKGDPINILGLLQYDAKGVFYGFLISTTIGYIIAFLINRKTTFAADSNVVVSAILYTLLVIFTILATAWIGAKIKDWSLTKAIALGYIPDIPETAVSEEYIPEAAKTWIFVGDNLGKPFAAALATAWTYPINRFVIHRHKGEKAEKKD
ncbi:MAG: hypothetical protein K5756_00695 [Clostridiales bacterium]|nr:hypothetical protein [Clostridiales bacterium]